MQENDAVVEAFFAIANEGEKEIETIKSFINGNPDLLAVRNKEGKTIILVANKEDKIKNMTVSINGNVLNLSLKPKSFNTLSIKL